MINDECGMEDNEVEARGLGVKTPHFLPESSTRKPEYRIRGGKSREHKPG
jgi:hypothetical protein